MMTLLDGRVARDCSGSVGAVKVATVKALNRMHIKVALIGKDAGDDIILAMSGERRVEVRVEALDTHFSRLHIRARQGEQNDEHTAAEVIAFTERMLAHPAARYS